MAHQIEVSPAGRWLLFLAGIAAVLAAFGRYLVQPLFAAWVFYTIRHEKAQMRSVIEEALASPLEEIRKGIREIRECQAEQGEQISDVAGYVRRMGEEGR